MTENTGATSLSDRGASYLRTVIPTLWGTFVAQVFVAISPHLPVDVVDALRDWLSGPAAVGVATAAGIAVWYWVARRVEPHVPDWLTRIILGSAAAPTYAQKTADGQAVIVTGRLVTTPDGSPVQEASLPVLTDEYEPKHLEG